ncbi:MAG: hypothetical protein JXN65_03275 [Clostridia bacterium]|nr:hypothetical protein [Clostridia bacterium]
MKCTQCKTVLPIDSIICTNCGKVNDEPSTGYKVAMWIFSILGGLIGIILSAGVVFGKLPDGTKRYSQKSRSSATIAFVIAVVVFALGMLARNM